MQDVDEDVWNESVRVAGLTTFSPERLYPVLRNRTLTSDQLLSIDRLAAQEGADPEFLLKVVEAVVTNEPAGE